MYQVYTNSTQGALLPLAQHVSFPHTNYQGFLSQGALIAHHTGHSALPPPAVSLAGRTQCLAPALATPMAVPLAAMRCSVPSHSWLLPVGRFLCVLWQQLCVVW